MAENILEEREVILDEDSDEEVDDLIDLDSEAEPEHEEVNIRFRSRRSGDTGNPLHFTPPYVGINRSAAPNIDKNSSPLAFFTLFFEEVFPLLLLETNRYFHQHCETQDVAGPSAKAEDIKFEEIFKFLALIIQMGHDQRDRLKDYWSKDEQYYTPFYPNTATRPFLAYFKISPFHEQQ